MMFAWGACTHSLTGIVCERVKQWETSQLTDTLSCSHFEWQQRMRGAVADPVWDSVQTALRVDRRLYQSHQSELLRSRCWEFIAVLEYCRLITLCSDNMFPWTTTACGGNSCLHVWLWFVLLHCKAANKAQWSLWLPRVMLWPEVK